MAAASVSPPPPFPLSSALPLALCRSAGSSEHGVAAHRREGGRGAATVCASSRGCGGGGARAGAMDGRFLPPSPPFGQLVVLPPADGSSVWSAVCCLSKAMVFYPLTVLRRATAGV